MNPHHMIDNLIAEYNQMPGRIRAMLANAPALRLVPETVTDDGETFDALRCPRCGSLVTEGELFAVDVSERWNPNWDVVTDHRSVSFDPADADYSETIYYRHGDAPGHAVALPLGWTEEWS